MVNKHISIVNQFYWLLSFLKKKETNKILNITRVYPP